MKPELGRKLLGAYHYLGIMDHEGLPLHDWWLDPRLDKIAADAEIEMEDEAANAARKNRGLIPGTIRVFEIPERRQAAL